MNVNNQMNVLLALRKRLHTQEECVRATFGLSTNVNILEFLEKKSETDMNIVFPCGKYFQEYSNLELNAYVSIIKLIYKHGTHEMLTDDELGYIHKNIRNGESDSDSRCYCRQCVEEYVDEKISSEENDIFIFTSEPTRNAPRSRNYPTFVPDPDWNIDTTILPDDTVFRFTSERETPSTNNTENDATNNAAENNPDFTTFGIQRRQQFREQRELEEPLEEIFEMLFEEVLDQEDEDQEDEDQEDEDQDEYEDIKIVMPLCQYRDNIHVFNGTEKNTGTCNICLDALYVDNPKTVFDSLLAKTQCNHTFHHTCLQKLCCEVGPPRCPLCRHDIRDSIV